jgi:hypothetical protein
MSITPAVESIYLEVVSIYKKTIEIYVANITCRWSVLWLVIDMDYYGGTLGILGIYIHNKTTMLFSLATLGIPDIYIYIYITKP